MGDVIMLWERLRIDRSSGGSRSALFFDLGCPFSYLAAERVERTLGDVDWVPCSLPADRRQLTPDLIARAERQAFALQLPLVWPDRFPGPVPIAMRAAATPPRSAPARGLRWPRAGWRSVAATTSRTARSSQRPPRLRRCRSTNASPPRAIAARDVRTAGDRPAPCVLRVPRLPAIRIGRRWLWSDQMLSEARPLLRNAAS